ncbi:50S ribosomal protein L30 [Aerococcus urinaehominis]|uniref:Large ribosomal subunit protein uL30 n=1 Tax=Aerococcus urinaehominis TaxID=128944 RepID=A0A0X8FKY3_9LACT|nr:50S ribosomal protein L30 [Aerococcus urinaehominis]AMB99132.1 50S ribosomal protein L30 [Aerococcus urinaehominis]SDM04762.1 large subunit ribosomal protein L30 [Aerococcus urinaehominis]
MAKYEITLVRSLIGRKQDQIATAKTLGLTKIGRTVTVESNDAIDGMVRKIQHLVEVKEAK